MIAFLWDVKLCVKLVQVRRYEKVILYVANAYEPLLFAMFPLSQRPVYLEINGNLMNLTRSPSIVYHTYVPLPLSLQI